MIYDLAIIGGGINGVGIAVDGAKRGLKVLLLEQSDLASGTSSASSKLIHGGLRYLEQYEFKLVREALSEREKLLRNAKHLVKPLQFILPHHRRLRPRWIIRLGLFFYDNLFRSSSLPKSRSISLRRHPSGKYLKEEYKYGFAYFDCITDDARLVITNALAAKQFQANILTYTECTRAIRNENDWQISARNKLSGFEQELKAKILINATGPWAENFLNQKTMIQSEHKLALIKGSHIVVDKLYEEEFAFILQNTDNRVVFIIPYLNQYSLIGTTDVVYTGSLGPTQINEEEINYLLNAINNYLKVPLEKTAIIHTFSGIRPLLQNQKKTPSEMTRDYTIELQSKNLEPPLVSLFGGKLTTYRRLAEKVIDLLSPFFNELKSSLTSSDILPGSDYLNTANLKLEFEKKYPWLPIDLLTRYIQQYGTRVNNVLENCNEVSELGKDFGHGLYQREIDYLITHEWAKNADDILWRRTKLGYQFLNEEKTELNKYIASVRS